MPVRTVRLGLELRQIRQEKNLTLKEASRLTQRSISSLSRIENGQVKLPERDVPSLLDAYGIKEIRRRDALMSLARDAHEKHWWQQYNDVLTTVPDFISLENEAAEIRTFQTLFIPGLAQIREYAYRIYESARPGSPVHALKRITDVRMRRQRILQRDDPPDYHAIVMEGALRQQIGGPQVMRRQLGHLATLAAQGRLSLQVLAFTAGAHGAEGSFTLLSVPALGGSLVHVDSHSEPGVLDDAEATDGYRLTFERLRSTALPEADSLALVERLAAEL